MIFRAKLDGNGGKSQRPRKVAVLSHGREPNRLILELFIVNPNKIIDYKAYICFLIWWMRLADCRGS